MSRANIAIESGLISIYNNDEKVGDVAYPVDAQNLSEVPSFAWAFTTLLSLGHIDVNNVEFSGSKAKSNIAAQVRAMLNAQ